jgi:hypothetical protein
MIGVLGIIIGALITKIVMINRSQKQFDEIAYDGFNAIAKMNNMEALRLYVIHLDVMGVFSRHTLSNIRKDYDVIKERIKLVDFD